MPTVRIPWTENFQSGTISAAKWNNWGGVQCVAANGRMEITTTLSTTYYGLDSNDRFNLTGSCVCIQVIDAGNQSLASLEVTPLQLEIDASNILFFLIAGGTLYAEKKVGGSQAAVASITYNSATMKYFRIMESAGTIYWDYSVDRSTWINLGTLATPFAITNLIFTLSVGTWATEASPTTGIFDNLNIIGTDYPGNMPKVISAGNGISIAS